MKLTYEQAARLAELANILRPAAATDMTASPRYLDGYIAGIEQAARILRDARLIVGEVLSDDPAHPQSTVDRYFGWYQDALTRAGAAEEERDQAVEALGPFATCTDIETLSPADLAFAKAVYDRLHDAGDGGAHG